MPRVAAVNPAEESAKNTIAAMKMDTFVLPTNPTEITPLVDALYETRIAANKRMAAVADQYKAAKELVDGCNVAIIALLPHISAPSAKK